MEKKEVPSQLIEELTDLAQYHFPLLHRVNPTTKLRQFLDGMDMTDLLRAVEAKYQIRISDLEFQDVENIKQLASLVDLELTHNRKINSLL